MLWKVAFLFLLAMGAMVMFKARPKGDERPPARRAPRFSRRRAKKKAPKVETAEKCPRCGAWVAPGASCACDRG
jgi:ribosomal protein L32